MKNKSTKNYPAVLEIIPIFLFFALSKYYDIFVATGALIVCSIINLVIGYMYTKTIHIISVVTAVLAVFLGGLTIILGNETFIKMKITLMNTIFALILISGYIFKKNYLKIVFKSQVNISDEGWKKLNVYWIFFFIFLATLNEIVWRHVGTDAWINFKVFGITLLTIIFVGLQYPLIKKYSIKED